MSRNHYRLNQRRWRAVRAEVLERDNWRCQLCGSWGNEVDHRVPLQWGGDPYSKLNLGVLCATCHIMKTREENTRPRTRAERRWKELVREMI